jgi:hypothetical protein
MEGMLASRDGHVLLRHRAEGADPVVLGRQVASELLDASGGRWLDDWSDSDPDLPGSR